MRKQSSSPIEMATDRSGALIYRIRVAPDGLPPVRSGDLAASWDAARSAAAAAIWGEPRFFRFRPSQADPLDLALTDSDASCWAEAVDAAWGLQTAYGLSMCLRLLGLVALLSESPSMRALCPLSRDGVRLDPALLRAVATVPLSPRGQLDERRVRAHLAVAAPFKTFLTHSGVSS